MVRADAMLTNSQIIVIAGIVLGAPVITWVTIWLVYRNRWLCPICHGRTVKFVIGYTRRRTAYFYCGTCNMHLKSAGKTFWGLLPDSCGFRTKTWHCEFLRVSRHEWVEVFGDAAEKLFASGNSKTPANPVNDQNPG
jgi:hypothetical protein